MSAAPEPLTQLEFVELLSDIIDDGRARHDELGILRSDFETIEDTEMHQFEQRLGTGMQTETTELWGELRILMANGQRWTVKVEAR